MEDVAHNQMLCSLLPSWPVTVAVVSTDIFSAPLAFRKFTRMVSRMLMPIRMKIPLQ